MLKMLKIILSVAVVIWLFTAVVQATGSSSLHGFRHFCGRPHKPSYGGYHGNRQYYSVGSVINYYCNHGYELHGRYQTVCIYHRYHGARWLYAPPVCRPREFVKAHIRQYHSTTVSLFICWMSHFSAGRVVKCSKLNDPVNGDVRISGTSVGSRAHYTCNVGHRLVGNRIRICQRNGKWSGAVPICQRKWY